MVRKGSRQHGVPLILKGGQSQRLKRVRLDGNGGDAFNEDWLQKLIFKNPNLLPVDEIEPAFSPLIPVCRELPTDAGPLDILFTNPRGMLTLVECKLWRNPEARRKVVGQILDYAKEFSKWSYEDLERAVRKASGEKMGRLYEMANPDPENAEEDEEVFIDTVTKNLGKGRFLLLIVGDGIREGVEAISNFLHDYANLNFTFALVEETVFELPDSNGKELLVQPRVIARTIEIERNLIRLDHKSLVMEPIDAPSKDFPDNGKPGERRVKISEEEFYKILKQVDSKAADLLPGFVDKCEDLGLYTKFGDSSLMLHWDNEDSVNFNFATFKKDGTIMTNYFAERAKQIGHLEIGEKYLENLASLLKGGQVAKQGNVWFWHVRKNSDFPSISEMLQVGDEWIEIMKTTMEQINEVSG
ncbi:MAG: hypothetical protein IIA63_01115 [Nitrospinae bacterium]|nr:hypothetical protein [Nitrospinota bacterium]